MEVARVFVLSVSCSSILDTVFRVTVVIIECTLDSSFIVQNRRSSDGRRTITTGQYVLKVDTELLDISTIVCRLSVKTSYLEFLSSPSDTFTTLGTHKVRNFLNTKRSDTRTIKNGVYEVRSKSFVDRECAFEKLKDFHRKNIDRRKCKTWKYHLTGNEVRIYLLN